MAFEVTMPHLMMLARGKKVVRFIAVNLSGLTIHHVVLSEPSVIIESASWFHGSGPTKQGVTSASPLAALLVSLP